MTTFVGTISSTHDHVLIYPPEVVAGDFVLVHGPLSLSDGFTKIPGSNSLWFRIYTASGNPTPNARGPWRVTAWRHAMGCRLGPVGGLASVSTGSHSVSLATPVAGRLVWALEGFGQLDGTPPATMTKRRVYSANADYTILSFDEQVSGGQHTRTASFSGGGVGQAFYVVPANDPPLAPTQLYPLTASEPLDRNITNRFSWRPNDPNVGDTQSRAEIRYRQRVDGSPWVTVNLVTPNAYWDVPAGTFAAANFEWQVRTYDVLGEVGPYSGSEFFTAGNAPTDLTVTSPANGATIGLSSAQVTWSTALAQQSSQMRQVGDSGGAPDVNVVYFDTGEMVNSATRTASASFNVNQRWEHVQVRIKVGGLWSGWVSRRVYVSYTTPLSPTVLEIPDPESGSVVVLGVHPRPFGSIPQVASQQLWSRALDGFRTDGIPITEFYAPNLGYRDYAIASDVATSYRLRVRGTNGTEAWSEWSGEEQGELAPANTSPPAISGASVVGNLLSYVPGSWEGFPTPTITRQWILNSGEVVGTGTSLTVLSAWVGATLTIVETATAGLSTGPVAVTATSAPTSQITSTSVTPVPSNVTAPATASTPVEATAYTGTAGTWENATSIERMWRWTT